MSHPNRRRQKKKHWFFSRWFLVTISIVFFLISASLIKEAIRSYRIEREISRLEQEINGLEKQNKDYSEFVEYLKTDVYFEEQARRKFGLKKPGEKVVVLKDEDNPSLSEEAARTAYAADAANAESGTSNVVLWWRYFFGGGEIK